MYYILLKTILNGHGVWEIIMSIEIRRSVAKVKCAVSGHEISDVDEDRLYVIRLRKINTNCSACGKPIEAEVDGTNEDEYFVTATE